MKTDILTKQENYANALKRFADHIKTTSDGALIVEATIVDIIDEGVGEYSVEYFGNTFPVYSSNRDLVYSVGDNVYISVPERDFSKTKIIIGLSNPRSAVFSNDDTNIIYYEISDNLIDNNELLDVIKMNSYRTTNVTKYLSRYSTTNYAKILNNYHTFQLSCEIQTKLPLEQQNSGNYGITLKLPLVINSINGQGETEVVWKEFPLNTSNMMGNFYRYETWSSQKVYFEIDPQYRIAENKMPTLSYYCEDFNQDNSKTDYDIFIKNISLIAVEVLSTSDESGFGLSLKASEGPYFGSYYKNKKTLTPTLRYNSRKVNLDTNNCEVYWFKENVDVKRNHADYCIYGGVGWQCLNPKTNNAISDDNIETFDWVTSNLTWEVPSSEIIISTRYKCVVIYKETQISAIITLAKLNVNISFDLQPLNGNNVLIKDTGYAHLVATVFYDDITDKDKYRNSFIYSWARYNKNGDYINDSDNFFEIVKNNEMVVIDNKHCYQTEVKFPVYAIADINTIYCSVKFVKEDLTIELLGTKSTILSTSTSYEYNLFIDNDGIIYKYDSNGDSPAGSAYDGPSTSKVTSIAPLNYTIKKASGEDFTGEEYCYVYYQWRVPKNSMFSNIRNRVPFNPGNDPNYDLNKYDYYEGYDNYNHDAANLVYEIASRFNLSKANEAILLTVKFKDKVFTKIVDINFIKEGQNGTNGTAYAARLVSGGTTADTSVPYGTPTEYGDYQKLRFIYNFYNQTLYCYDYTDHELKVWKDGYVRKIYPKVYKNSEEIRPAYYGEFQRELFDVEYTMFDEKITTPCLKIESVDEEDYGVILNLRDDIDWSDKWTVWNSNFCNILQAKITVTRGNSSIIHSNETIYVYYPIEFTIVDTDQLLYVPCIEGGFSEVMYASDGTNPSWDQTAPFKLADVYNQHIVDYIDEIYWEAQHHITPHEPTWPDYPSRPYNNIKFTPDNKYDDGNSKNYVKVEYWLSQWTIEREIRNLEANIETLENQKNQINFNKNKLIEFGNNYYYTTWKNQLNQVKPLLDIETNMIYAAKGIVSYINQLFDYYNAQKEYSDKPIEETCNTLMDAVTNLQTYTETAIIKIQEYKENFNNLISLADYMLSFNQEIYKQNLGLNIEINFEILVNNINQVITTYQTLYNQIKDPNYDYINYLSSYNLIISNMTETTNILNNSNMYNRYLDLYSKVLVGINFFNQYTSFKDLNNLIDTIYNNILSSTFDLENNSKLKLKDVINNELTTEYEECEKLLDEKQLIKNNLIHMRDHPVNSFCHIRPIVTYLNRYSMSNINAWDGNKIETGDGTYLLAPQVGAGKKNYDNSFTGIVIGQRNLGENGIGNAQLGLFGYSYGRQSIFLNAENGAAIFGVAGPIVSQDRRGGQIIIDPNNYNNGGTSQCLLYSSIYWKKYNNETGLPINYSEANKTYNGMCLDLSQSILHLGNFDGKIYSGHHTSPYSTAGGFYLSYEGLYVSNENATNRLSISTTGISPKFYCNGKSSLTNTAGGFYLSADGLSLGSSIKIDAAGAVKVGYGAVSDQGKYWTISGNNDGNSFIAYGTRGRDGSVYLGTDKITLGQYFSVNNNGTMTAARGKIGGFWLSSDGVDGGSPGFFNEGNKLAIAAADGAIGAWGDDSPGWPDTNYAWMLNKHAADFKVPVNAHNGISASILDIVSGGSIGTNLLNYLDNRYARKGTYSLNHGKASVGGPGGATYIGSATGDITI